MLQNIVRSGAPDRPCQRFDHVIRSAPALPRVDVWAPEDDEWDTRWFTSYKIRTSGLVALAVIWREIYLDDLRCSLFTNNVIFLSDISIESRLQSQVYGTCMLHANLSDIHH